MKSSLDDPAPRADTSELTARVLLLAACVDNLMRFLLTGCRQHGERAVLLLEHAQSHQQDAAFQDLCNAFAMRLRACGFDQADFMEAGHV